MNSLEIYEKHHKLIHLIYNSRLKIQILLTLIGGNAPLSRLREVTGSTSQALIPKIRSLESLSLIESVNYEYRLTPIGRLVAESIENYVSLMGGIDKHQAFLMSHELSDIPHEFLRRISELYLAEVKYDATTDIFFVYRHYVDILKDARYIHGISSAISPVLATFLAEKIAQGVPVELVVNRDVVDTLKQEPYISNIRELFGSGNFLLFVTEESLKLGLTVSDKYISLGFYKLGTDQYDTSTDLFSDDPQALAWAEELFTYFRDRAQPLDLNLLLYSREDTGLSGYFKRSLCPLPRPCCCKERGDTRIARRIEGFTAFPDPEPIFAGKLPDGPGTRHTHDNRHTSPPSFPWAAAFDCAADLFQVPLPVVVSQETAFHLP